MEQVHMVFLIWPAMSMNRLPAGLTMIGFCGWLVGVIGDAVVHMFAQLTENTCTLSLAHRQLASDRYEHMSE